MKFLLVSKKKKNLTILRYFLFSYFCWKLYFRDLSGVLHFDHIVTNYLVELPKISLKTYYFLLDMTAWINGNFPSLLLKYFLKPFFLLRTDFYIMKIVSFSWRPILVGLICIECIAAYLTGNWRSGYCVREDTSEMRIKLEAWMRMAFSTLFFTLKSYS